MADLVKMSVEIDQTKINAAMAMALKYSRSSSPQLVIDSTALHVVKKAMAYTPFVSPAQMDVELGTIVVPKSQRKLVATTGRRLPRKIYAGVKQVSMMRFGKPSSMPLAAAIIQATVVRPDIGRTPTAKKYNFRTNFRYARLSSPFRGKSRAAGRAAMRAAVHRLIATRHKSSKFLIAGWVDVRNELRLRVFSGIDQGESDFLQRPNNRRLGEVRRSETVGSYVLEIVNMIGTEPGLRGNNAANYNRALMVYGGPALQKALDQEASEKIRIYFARSLREHIEPAFK